jgi:RecJ-like exonuclease
MIIKVKITHLCNATCPRCFGSGEGRASGTTCPVCHGTGSNGKVNILDTVYFNDKNDLLDIRMKHDCPECGKPLASLIVDKYLDGDYVEE